jgi:hypothetical protein
VPGHYQGTTSQNEAFFFDVTADGFGLTGLGTGQVNESCDLNGLTLYGGNLRGGGANINPDGTFSISSSSDGMVGDSPSHDTTTITGRFTGATASGTILVTTSFAYQGTPVNCTSNAQTWTATHT